MTSKILPSNNNEPAFSNNNAGFSNNMTPSYPSVTYQQPNSTTNIIISQPQTGSVAKRDWSHGLCGCFDDCGEFIFAYFCTLCYECRLFSLANEGFCSCLFGGLVPLRTKIRTERGIEGSICGDFWTVAFCPFCSMIQMANEIKSTKAMI